VLIASKASRTAKTHQARANKTYATFLPRRLHPFAIRFSSFKLVLLLYINDVNEILLYTYCQLGLAHSPPQSPGSFWFALRIEIHGADQKDGGLWGREWVACGMYSTYFFVTVPVGSTLHNTVTPQYILAQTVWKS